LESIQKRAQAAYDTLIAMHPTSQLHTDQSYREGVAARLLNDATYDWGKINATLFPEGDLSKVDVTSPSFAAEWSAIRTGHRDRVAKALHNYSPSNTFTYKELGLEIRLSPSSMSPYTKLTYAGEQIVEALASVGLGWSLIGDRLDWSNSGQPRVHYGTRYAYIVGGMRDYHSNCWGSLYNLSGRKKDTVFENAEFQGILKSLRAIIRYDWAGLKQRFSDEWDEYHKNSTPPPPPTQKRPLGDYIQEKISLGQQVKDPTDALAMFHEFPILGKRAKNANSSRHYGVEMEITDAGHIRYPQGWARERDHSLRQHIGDGNTYDPWEFISPVLGKTFDQGMWMVCDQAAGTIPYWRAGVHVHVEAKDKRGRPMTTAQVSRLLELYTVISPLIDPVLQRGRSREFCIPTRFDQWGNGWFVAPASGRVKPHRQQLQLNGKRAHLARDNAAKWAQITHGPNHDQEPTEWKRHQEINLQALNKYGTIEFRAMGSVYDYEYLTRWAWLLRELMNIAQDDSRDLRPFYQAVTLEEVLHLINNQAVEALGRQRVKL
jgi:hypothetical protein